MRESQETYKVYPLILSSRLVLIVPGILLTLIGLFIFFVADDSSGDNWWIALLFIGFGCTGIYASFAARLTTSSEGIKYYYFLNFYSEIPWGELKKIELAQSGDANLIINYKKIFGNTIQLSYFADDWENCELIRDIQTYAPHLKIPEWLLSRPKLKFWHRPGGMMLYYMLCMVFATLTLSPLAISFFAPMKFSVLQATWGFVMGVFSGMLALKEYTPWMNRHRDNQRIDEIGKLARWHYVFPFSGWAITLVLGLTIQALFIGWEYSPDQEESFFRLIVICAPIIQIFFLPYMRTNEKR